MNERETGKLSSNNSRNDYSSKLSTSFYTQRSLGFLLKAVGELSHLRSPVGFFAHVRLSTCSLETIVTNVELLSAELGN